MRVVALTHVFPRADGDPSAPFLATWARALADAGAGVTVVAPHDDALALRDAVDGVAVRRARYAPAAFERLAYRGEMHQLVRRPWGPPALAGLLGSMARVTRSVVAAGDADVVHVHWWVPGAIIARLARLPVPVVCTVHGTDVAMVEQRPAIARLARWALAGCDRVEAVSSDLAERLQASVGVTADAIAPMPLDAAALAATPGPPDAAAGPGGPAASTDAVPVKVLAAGRMVPEKGFADLIAALGRLQRRSELTIVGEGPEHDRLRQRAAAEGVTLALPGTMAPATLREAYGLADVVVVASHREGFGLVACEAACRGTPVVATDSGGARDVLDRQWLVPPGDVAALATAIDAVAADPAAARRRAGQVAERVRHALSPPAAAQRAFTAYHAVGAG